MQVQFLYGIWMCMVNAGWFILVAYLFTTKNIRNVFLKKKDYSKFLWVSC